MLVVGGERIPRAVVRALQSSPLEWIPVSPMLDGVQLTTSDVLLIASQTDAAALRNGLFPTESSRVRQHPTVIVLGDPSTCALENSPDMDVTFVALTTDTSAISRQVLKAVTAGLVRKGVIKRRRPSSAPSTRPARLSRRPPRASSRPSLRVGVGPPSFFQADLRSSTSSTGFDALRLPEPPPLPHTDTFAVERSSAPSGAPIKAPRSLMPKAVNVEGSRWLLLDDDVARAHAIASAVEACGGQVEVSGLAPTSLRMHALKDLDASGVLVAESSLPRLSGLLEGFEADPRLRWVPFVPVRWSAVFDEETGYVDREALKLLLLPHWQPDHDLVEKLLVGHTIDVARIGPAKLIRAAGALSGGIELEFQSGGQLWVLGLCSGELVSVQQNGQNCFADDCGRALDTVLNLLGGSACLLRMEQTPPAGSFGPIAEILKAQAFDGAPMVPRARHALLNRMARAVADAKRVVSPLSAPLVRRWEGASATHKNAVALGAGVVSTSLTAWIVLAGLGLLEPAESVDTLPSASVQAEASAPLAPPSAREPVAPQPSRRDAPQVAKPGKSNPAEQKGTDNEPASASDSAGAGYPSGCGRWVTAQQPLLPQPQQAVSAWRMARKSIQVGNLAKAEEMLCISASMDATGPGPADLVKFHFSQNNLSAATNWAEWAFRQKPQDPELKQLLADVRSRQGRLDEARALLHDAMNVSAADVRVLRQVARKYANSGHKALQALDPGQAERLFRRAVVLDDKNVLATAGMAEVSLRNGDLEAAMDYAKRAVDMSPRSFEAQLALGDVYAETKQQEEAKRAWLEAARLRPSSKEARKRLGL